MNRLAVLAVLFGALANSACTTLTPQEETPEELQRQLLSGELLQAGERVRLVTTDESVYEFRITEIDLEQGLVIGGGERVPIADVIAVETRKVSAGKTALLVGGVGTSVLVIITVLLAPALLLSGG